MNTLGQQRAEYCLEKLEKLPKDLRSDFKPFTAGLPALILQNGFGQALAFLKAKANGPDKHQEAFSIIVAWLVKRDILKNAGNDTEYLKQISRMEQQAYLHAQKETLAMLEWLKRYANAELF